MNNKPNHIGIVICLYTGIRIGELLALTWDDIDFDQKILSINKNVSTVKIEGKRILHVDTPKTKSSKRIIPIPKQLFSIIKRYHKKSKSNYIITTRDNKMVDTRSYQKTYFRILNKLNIKYRNFHSLRHTFASRAVEFGMDIKVELDTENNAEARALYSAVERGDITGMSFMFGVDSEEWDDIESDHPTRRIKAISTVVEVSAVTFPAYSATEINARSKEALDNARSALESVRQQEVRSVDTDELALAKAKFNFKSKLGGN